MTSDRLRILGTRDKVVVEATVCDEHHAAVERDVPCIYQDPPGALYRRAVVLTYQLTALSDNGILTD